MRATIETKLIEGDDRRRVLSRHSSRFDGVAVMSREHCNGILNADPLRYRGLHERYAL
jgi:hypothetical protein